MTQRQCSRAVDHERVGKIQAASRKIQTRLDAGFMSAGRHGAKQSVHADGAQTSLFKANALLCAAAGTM
jgi:hypothetical protein